MAKNESATRVAERSVESSASAVEWGTIFAGGVAAIGITIILLTLGPGLGLTAVSPWIQKPVAYGFWYGGRDLARGHAVAFVRLWRLSDRLTSDKMGWNSHRRGSLQRYGARALGLGIGNIALGGPSYIRLRRDSRSGCGGSINTSDTAQSRSSRAGTQNRSRLCLHDIALAFNRPFVASAAGALGGFHRDEA
jgi:hypothetical protein